MEYVDIDGKTHWACGCITYSRQDPKGRGKMFVNEACDAGEKCPVVITVHKTSNEKNIPIEHYRREDFG